MPDPTGDELKHLRDDNTVLRKAIAEQVACNIERSEAEGMWRGWWTHNAYSFCETREEAGRRILEWLGITGDLAAEINREAMALWEKNEATATAEAS
jgi:hypothetical protein